MNGFLPKLQDNTMPLPWKTRIVAARLKWRGYCVSPPVVTALQAAKEKRLVFGFYPDKNYSQASEIRLWSPYSDMSVAGSSMAFGSIFGRPPDARFLYRIFDLQCCPVGAVTQASVDAKVDSLETVLKHRRRRVYDDFVIYVAENGTVFERDVDWTTVYEYESFAEFIDSKHNRELRPREYILDTEELNAERERCGVPW